MTLDVKNIILFKYFIKDSKYDFIFGEIAEIADDSVKVMILNDDFLPTSEFLQITNSDIVCNLFNNPYPGIIYGKEIKNPPIQKIYEGNLIYIHLPYEYKIDADLQNNICENILKEFKTFFEKHKNSKQLGENCFEFHFKVGNYEKSNFSKKSKNDLHGTFEFFIDFGNIEVVRLGMVYGLGSYLWNQSSYDLMAKWLKHFSDQFTLEFINRKDIENLFLECLEKPKKDLGDLSAQDSIIFNLIIKEITRVKHLSFKELKLIKKKIGSDYILQEVLPSVINALSVQGAVIPPIKTNSKKLFLSNFSDYIVNNLEVPEELKTTYTLVEEFLN